MSTVLRLFAAVLLGCALTPAHAQIYKWVDAKGVVNYSNSPPAKGRATMVTSGERLSIIPAGGISAAEVDALEERIAARRRAEAEADAAASEVAYSDTSYPGYEPGYRYTVTRGALDAPYIRPPYGIGIGSPEVPLRPTPFDRIPGRR